MFDVSWSRQVWQERRRTAIAVIVAVVLMAAALVALAGGPPGKSITAYFASAVGVHPGSDVRILGVEVGEIEEVTPVGRQVRVRVVLDRGVEAPADAKAVVVAPSVVADRYVQLTPAYSGGPRIADDAEIPLTRTATPVELDKLYDSLTRMMRDLGPKGINSQGALSHALKVGAENMYGNGQAFNDMIRQFGQASKTLAGSSEDLFGTFAHLQKFTTMIKRNDSQVRQVQRQLADVTGILAADRDELGAALNQLAIALKQVRDFIGDHRALLKKDVDKLASITQVLVDQRKSLAEAMDVLPLNATNVLNTYDPRTRTLMGRGNLNEISMGPISGTDVGNAIDALRNGSASARCASALAASSPQCNAAGGSGSGSGTGGSGSGSGGSATGILPPMPLPTVSLPAQGDTSPKGGGQ